MKIGDLVKVPDLINSGIIIGFEKHYPIVFWCNEYPEEREYQSQLKVISGKDLEDVCEIDNVLDSYHNSYVV